MRDAGRMPGPHRTAIAKVVNKVIHSALMALREQRPDMRTAGGSGICLESVPISTWGGALLVAAIPDEVMFAPVRQIQGFVLACLVDASSGMVLGSLQDRDDIQLPVAAAGAADVINVVSMMTGELAMKGDIEDVIITLDSHYHLIRLLKPGPGRQYLVLVTLERPQANLAMALREIRDFGTSLFNLNEPDRMA